MYLQKLFPIPIDGGHWRHLSSIFCLSLSGVLTRLSMVDTKPEKTRTRREKTLAERLQVTCMLLFLLVGLLWLQ